MATDAIFHADPEGWRASNLGRPAGHLVREVVQNAADEAATRIEVDLRYDTETRSVVLRVTDDVEGGFRDPKLIFTLWLSDKTDSPTKRGRMGRGLKEVISVADLTVIRSQGCDAIQFERVKGKWTRTTPDLPRPARGTVVECRVSGRSWTKRDVRDALVYLGRIRPPAGTTLVLNGQELRRAPAKETYRITLPSIVFDMDDGGRVQRERRFETTVELFEDSDPQVLEMGIPIESIDFPLSIDVGQRIPLREKRDTITEPWRRELFAKLLEARIAAGLVGEEQMRDGYVLVAAEAKKHLSEGVQKKIVDAWTGGRPWAGSSDSLRAATGQHVSVVPLRSLPEPVRDLAKEVGTNVSDVLRQRVEAAAAGAVRTVELAEGERRAVDLWEWISQGVNRPSAVRICRGTPSAEATYCRATSTLSVFVENAPFVVADPLGWRALSLLIHELANWTPGREAEHGIEFHGDGEYVGGKVAAFLLQNADEARRRVGGGVGEDARAA